MNNNSKKKYNVVVVGELNIDLIANRLSKFPEIGKEILADSLTITMGSSSAIFASNLSVLGSKVTFIGKLGNDQFGDHIISSFKSKNVDVSNIVRTGMSNTGVTIVLNYDEERAMVTYPGAMSSLRVDDVSDEALKEADHLHVSSIFLQKNLKKDIAKLLKRAKDLGLTTSLDPQWDPHEKWDIDFKILLQHVDIFLPNQAELKAIMKASTIYEAVDGLKNFVKILVIKNGRNGAVLWTKEEEFIHQPAFVNEDVVDSIGAGDSFNAGFMFKFLHGETLKDCLEFGALIGAISTTSPGGTSAFESMDGVKQIAKSSFNYIF